MKSLCLEGKQRKLLNTDITIRDKLLSNDSMKLRNLY